MKGGDMDGVADTAATQPGARRGRGWRRPGAEVDLLYARLSTHQQLLERTRRQIEQALSRECVWCVLFSGGKDSTVLLHLVREQRPDVPALFIDSGAEFPETYDLIGRTPNVITQHVGMTLLDMYRTTGLFGAEAVQPGTHWRANDIKQTMITTPIAFANQLHGFTGNLNGLRAEEAAGRRKLAKAHGWLWQAKDGVWRCSPLLDWSVRDVWAHIAANDLDYNAAYDVMDQLGVPREQQRVAPYCGGTAIGRGRWAVLKRGWPELWNRFAAEFVKATQYV